MNANLQQQAALCGGCGLVFGAGVEPRRRRRGHRVRAPSGVEVVGADATSTAGYRAQARHGALEVRAEYRDSMDDKELGQLIGFLSVLFALPVVLVVAIEVPTSGFLSVLALGGGLVLAICLGMLVATLAEAAVRRRRARNPTRVHVFADRLVIESERQPDDRRELALAELERLVVAEEDDQARWAIEPGDRVHDLLVDRIGPARARYLDWLVAQFLGARERGESFVDPATGEPPPPIAARVEPTPAANESEARGAETHKEETHEEETHEEETHEEETHEEEARAPARPRRRAR